MISKTELAKEKVEFYIQTALKNNTQYSKRFIAGVLFAEHPDRFSDAEDARGFIRAVTGAQPRARGNQQIKKYEDLARRFATIPGPIRELENPEPFVIPTTIQNTLLLSDLHGQFYDRNALEFAINYGLKKNCDSVLINGDYMDNYGDSRFDQSPPVLQKIIDENEWGVEMLKLLQDTFGSVFLKQGNHDLRRQLHIERMARQMPELMNMSTYADALFFDGCRVQFIEDYRLIEYGKLNIIHGHEIQGGGGVHVAHNRLMKAQDNIASSHSHIGQSKILKNIKGKIMGSWALGCLCNLQPRYNPMNGWTHGFGVVQKNSSGDFEIDNRAIYGSKSFPV